MIKTFKSYTEFIKLFLFIVTFLLSITSNAQLTDIARIEYSFIPLRNSEDDYERFRILLNYPIEVKEDAYVVVGFDYNLVSLDLEEKYPFDSDLLSRIHLIDLSLGYTFKINEKWRFGAKISPRIASTLNESITLDDFFLNGGIYFVNDRIKDESAKKPYRLILGLSYNSTTGLPFPLPIVNYHREINEKWAFSFGVPKSNLKYKFNDKNIVQAFVTLDGYFANIQKPILIDDKLSDHVSLSILVSGLGYEYNFTKHLISYIYTGYTISLSNELRDGNRDSVFSLSKVNTFYLRTGLKFKI